MKDIKETVEGPDGKEMRWGWDSDLQKRCQHCKKITFKVIKATFKVVLYSTEKKNNPTKTPKLILPTEYLITLNKLLRYESRLTFVLHMSKLYNQIITYFEKKYHF